MYWKGKLLLSPGLETPFQLSFQLLGKDKCNTERALQALSSKRTSTRAKPDFKDSQVLFQVTNYHINCFHSHNSMLAKSNISILKVSICQAAFLSHGYLQIRFKALEIKLGLDYYLNQRVSCYLYRSLCSSLVFWLYF